MEEEKEREMVNEEEEEEMEERDPITKARLYYSTSDQTWSELGVGVVSIVYEDNTEETKPISGGKVGPAEPRKVGRSGKILLRDLEVPDEIILQTPISYDDIYVVQDGIILVWKDQLLAKELALSFSDPEGCAIIKEEIEEYRMQHRSSVGEKSDFVERWVVKRENLDTILHDATENAHRFGNFLKNSHEFIKQLVQLFTSAEKEKEEVVLDKIGKIVLSLLRSPYSTDASIIAQFVEEASIDKIIDIVQYGLGRRSEETGFVSLEKRRATFRNPLHLKEPILSRIHLIYSAGYLKDMLPLNFEEDVMSPSILGLYLLRFNFSLMADICATDGLMEEAFSKVIRSDKVLLGDCLDLLGLLNDMAKSIKNSVFPNQTKEPIIQNLIKSGLFPFMNRALSCAISEYERLIVSNKPSEEVKMTEKAIQMCCDVMNCSVTLLPSSRQDLIEESSRSPSSCTLNLLMKAVSLMRSSCVARSILDFISSCVSLSPYQMLFFQEKPKIEKILYFLVNGRVGDKSPLFGVATSTAALLKIPLEENRNLKAHEEIQLIHSLKLLEMICDSLKDNLTNSFVELLTLSGILSSITALVDLDRRALSNVQSSSLSLVAKCIDKGGPHLPKLFLDQPHVLEGLMSVFLRRSSRNNLLLSSLGSVFRALCERTHVEKSGIEKSSFSVDPYFMSIMHADDSVSKAESSPFTFESVLSALKERHAERLETQFPVLYARMEKVLRETPEEAFKAETSSIASTTERNVPFEVQMEEFDVDMIGTTFHTPMQEVSDDNGLDVSPIRGDSDDENSNDSIKRQRETDHSDDTEKRLKGD